MREIKFRAWDKGAKKLYHVSDMYFGSEGCLVVKTTDGEKFTGLKNVREYELMQFTGFHDSKGKEIYEGDILKVFKLTFKTSGTLPDILNVEYLQGMFQLFRGDQCLMGLHLSYIKECEVIGNIYEGKVV